MTLLQMSMQGAVLIAVAAAVRAAAKNRLPRQTFPVLWGVVLARLLVPFSIPSRCSAYTAANRNPVIRTVSAAAIRIESAPQEVELWHISEIPWKGLWTVGAAALTLYFILGYLHFLREFRFSLPVEDTFCLQWLESHKLRRRVRLRQSGSISAPLTYGILRPVILLPKTTDWSDTEQLRYILMHEATHIRRFDPLWKLLSTAALCLHWFNPLVWLMCALFSRDLELSCDDCVMRQLGGSFRQAYAMTLIELEERKSGLFPFQAGFSRTAIEERIRAVMQFRKPSPAAAAAAVLLVAGIAAVFATSAKAVSPLSAKDAAMLKRFQFPGWEDMTIDEYRERAWVLLDEPEMHEWWLSVEDNDEYLGAQHTDPLCSFLYNVIDDLTVPPEIYSIHQRGGYEVTNFEGCDQAQLEYTYRFEIPDPSAITVGAYLEALDTAGVSQDMRSLLHSFSKEQLMDGAAMRAALGERIRAIDAKWDSGGIQISPIEWSFQPLVPFTEEPGAQDSGGQEEQLPTATEDDLRSLLELKTENYKSMSVEEFNAALLEWANEDYERMDRVSGSTERNQFSGRYDWLERKFFTLTTVASGMENAMMIRSQYTGRPEEDPTFGGNSYSRGVEENGRAAFFDAYYQFSYHIVDKSKTPVGERDRCVGGFIQQAEDFFNDTPIEELLTLDKAAVVDTLTGYAEKNSSKNVQIHISEDDIGWQTMDERGMD